MKKKLKEVRDKMQDFEDKGSYLLTLEMFKNFPDFRWMDEYYRNNE